MSSQLCDQTNVSSQLSSKLLGLKNPFFCHFLWFFGWFWLIMAKIGQLWSNMINQRYCWFISVVFFVHLSVFLVKFWSNICQFLCNFSKFFFLSFFSKNCFVKSIIYSIIIGSQMSRQLFAQILLEFKYQGNYFLNYYLTLFSHIRFWVKSRSKPRLRGQGSVKGLDRFEGTTDSKARFGPSPIPTMSPSQYHESKFITHYKV